MAPMDYETPAMPERWHIKREVTTGDIFTIITGAFSFVCLVALGAWQLSKIESRQTALEASILVQRDMQQRIDAAQDQNIRDSVGRVEQAARDIQSYLLRINAPVGRP